MTECKQIDGAIGEQGSPEWHAWRAEHYMASESAIVMACAPYYWEVRTPEELRLAKAGKLVPEPSAETLRLWADGHRIEAEVRDRLNESWHSFEPSVFERGTYGASVDGWDQDSAEWFECKAPRDANSKTYRVASGDNGPRGRIPDHYWWQLVQQAYCVPDGAASCRYIVAPADGSTPREIVIPRSTLLEDWPRLEAAWQAFRDVRPNLPPESDEALGVEYIAALREHDHAKARLDRAKEALLAAGPRTIPELVTITESSVKGRIDWQKAARAAGVDDESAEEYRAASSTRSAIKLLETAA